MRKLLLALACVISLGGCATVEALFSISQFATASISNPVTPDMLNKIELGMRIALDGLKTYRQSCIDGLAEVNCRRNIVAIQAYTRRIPPLLTQARSFVRNNDQIDAIVVYNQIVALIANFKSAATAAGVAIKGV